MARDHHNKPRRPGVDNELPEVEEPDQELPEGRPDRIDNELPEVEEPDQELPESDRLFGGPRPDQTLPGELPEKPEPPVLTPQEKLDAEIERVKTIQAAYESNERAKPFFDEITRAIEAAEACSGDDAEIERQTYILSTHRL